LVGTFDLGETLQDLFQAQGGRCYYTGEPLIAGQNASLDHQTPRTRNGSNDISNVKWVSTLVNRMKQNLTHEEFLNLCEIITEKFSGSSAVAVE